jgi:hypothetical protein
MESQLSCLHILIMSYNYGSGHHRVAEVSAHALHQRVPDRRVEIYDYIETRIGAWYNLIFTSFCFGSVPLGLSFSIGFSRRQAGSPHIRPCSISSTVWANDALQTS